MKNELHLETKEREAIAKYKEILINKYQDQIKEIFLYGSKAREDSRQDSDIDLLIVLANYNWKLGDKIRRIGYELDEEIEYKFSIIVLAEQKFENLKKEKYQFAQNIMKDGIAI
ncbi:MAG: nucleotidyltransferase domain-containing protein [Spirochaetota bacterium]